MTDLSPLAIALVDPVTGFFRKLGIDILTHAFEHLVLVVGAMTIATAVALPLGIYLSRDRRPRLTGAVMAVAGMIQTVPSLAMVALVVVLFYAIKLPTIGLAPGLTALVLYALLPILRNTYTGIQQVDPSVVEVAKGMGMTPTQILLRVELPLSLPVIMAGVRISAVWTIGVAALVGLVGAGGLGNLIIRGLRNYQMDYILAGTLPAAALALTGDFILQKVQDWLTPAGVEEQASPA
ncbi:MAG: ABC transporter permease [Candidatus Brocadiaceae bacterium]|jgi:osmoprotectant transport system permease protein